MNGRSDYRYVRRLPAAFFTAITARAPSSTPIGDGIWLSEHLDGVDGATIFRHTCAMGLEGIVQRNTR
jgi:hypothetical protein